MDDDAAAEPARRVRGTSKHLRMVLSRMSDHPDAKAHLEQHRTPGDVAARLLMAADEEGDLQGRRVLDLGTGTGVFAIGAALLGATAVYAVDVDEAALRLAREAADREGVADVVTLEAADVAALGPDDVAAALGGRAETTVMNPPFGADHRSRARGGDRIFLSCAFRSSDVVLSLHPAHTERFLVAFARDAGFTVSKLGEVAFPLVGRYAHHRDLVRSLQVGLYRFVRDGHERASE